jgi:hypothetical protein
MLKARARLQAAGFAVAEAWEEFGNAVGSHCRGTDENVTVDTSVCV